MYRELLGPSLTRARRETLHGSILPGNIFLMVADVSLPVNLDKELAY